MADHGTLPVNVQDRLINAARHGLSNLQHQAVLAFGGRINERRLERAVRLSLDAEPILGSRFVERSCRPCWQRYADLDGIEWFVLEKTNDKAKAVHRFLASPLDGKHEQQVKVRLIRARDNDTLCIKMTHTCCDGGGLKAYQHMLSGIYTQLGKDKNFTMELNAPRKDQNHLLAKLGMANLLKVCGPGLIPPGATWAFPSYDCEPGELLVSIRRLPKKYVESLAAYAKRAGVSMNDLIITAFYRSLFEVIDPPPGQPREMIITVDLRRYFQDEPFSAINNLSSAVFLRISRVPGESFGQTLGKVAATMGAIKGNLPGIHLAVLFGLLSLLRYEQNIRIVQGIKRLITQTGRCSPILSNIGNISKSRIWFGQTPVVDAYHVSPAIYAPGFMLGACTYNKQLTFTVSYYEPGTSRGKVECFLEVLLQELKSWVELSG